MSAFNNACCLFKACRYASRHFIWATHQLHLSPLRQVCSSYIWNEIENIMIIILSMIIGLQ